MNNNSINSIVWFWFKDTKGEYRVSNGEIAYKVGPSEFPYYYIISFDGFSIHLPPERLFNNIQDCIVDAKSMRREQVLNQILINE